MKIGKRQLIVCTRTEYQAVEYVDLDFMFNLAAVKLQFIIEIIIYFCSAGLYWFLRLSWEQVTDLYHL